MALALVRDASNASTVGASSFTVTWPATPTQNDLLVATFFTRSAQATNPTGFATDVERVNTTEDDRVRIVSKIAGASEGNPQWTNLDTTDGAGSGSGIFEFSGNATTTPLDKTAS